MGIYILKLNKMKCYRIVWGRINKESHAFTLCGDTGWSHIYLMTEQYINCITLHRKRVAIGKGYIYIFIYSELNKINCLIKRSGWSGQFNRITQILRSKKIRLVVDFTLAAETLALHEWAKTSIYLATLINQLLPNITTKIMTQVSET